MISSSTPFGRALSGLEVIESSSDGHILARKLGRSPIRVAFRTPESIDEYSSASQLGNSVAQALTRTATLAQTELRKLIKENTRLRLTGQPPADATRRRFHADIDGLAACGLSPNGTVDVTATALISWDVIVDAEAFETVSPQRFCTEVNAAIRDAHRDYDTQVFTIKQKHFSHIGPPRREIRPRRHSTHR